MLLACPAAGSLSNEVSLGDLFVPSALLGGHAIICFLPSIMVPLAPRVGLLLNLTSVGVSVVKGPIRELDVTRVQLA